MEEYLNIIEEIINEVSVGAWSQSIKESSYDKGHIRKLAGAVKEKRQQDYDNIVAKLTNLVNGMEKRMEHGQDISDVQVKKAESLNKDVNRYQKRLKHVNDILGESVMNEFEQIKNQIMECLNILEERKFGEVVDKASKVAPERKRMLDTVKQFVKSLPKDQKKAGDSMVKRAQDRFDHAGAYLLAPPEAHDAPAKFIIGRDNRSRELVKKNVNKVVTPDDLSKIKAEAAAKKAAAEKAATEPKTEAPKNETPAVAEKTAPSSAPETKVEAPQNNGEKTTKKTTKTTKTNTKGGKK